MHFHPQAIHVPGDITLEATQKRLIELCKEQKIKTFMITPPCQGFSVAGKRTQNDPRNSLIFAAFPVIDAIEPDYILIENVIQYFKDPVRRNGKLATIPEHIDTAYGKKYQIKRSILNAADYGVPQNRKRGFILMTKNGLDPWDFPPPKRGRITVREAIGDLPSLEPKRKGVAAGNAERPSLTHHDAPVHKDMHIDVMRHTKTGQTALNNHVHYPKKPDGTRIRGFPTTYRRMRWDDPAPTITMANGSVSSQNNVHPGRRRKDGTYSDARVLTIREILILSSLPADWNIPEWASEGFVRKVIGEGIPPKLVAEIFKMVPR